ncbi:MAG: 4-phosphoerythronate dehydrogenase [Prevotella sp.]|nr:4-phosphoerythronate dehydrogenase [Prevotella sp.]
MKIIVDDKIPYIRETLALLTPDVEYIRGSEISASDVRDADALIVRTRTRCDSRLLKGSKVQFVATATIGIDHLDTEWMDNNGICWVNCPGCNANSVAQYMETAMLRLGVDRAGVVMGIVGCGHVGSAVRRRMEQMGIEVMVCDPFVADPTYVSLEELVAKADVVTFHVPLTRVGIHPTWHLADRRLFDVMRKRRNRPLKCMVNTSRGGVIDEKALLQAMDDGLVEHSVIDTWEGEPDINRELLRRAFIATPHIAGYSADGKVTADNMVIEAMCQYFGMSNPGKIIPPSLPSDFIYTGAPLELYDPLVDTARLRACPEGFEEQRGNYPLRRELFS